MSLSHKQKCAFDLQRASTTDVLGRCLIAGTNGLAVIFWFGGKRFFVKLQSVRTFFGFTGTHPFALPLTETRQGAGFSLLSTCFSPLLVKCVPVYTYLLSTIVGRSAR